jgi:hypothetical protein
MGNIGQHKHPDIELTNKLNFEKRLDGATIVTQFYPVIFKQPVFPAAGMPFENFEVLGFSGQKENELYFFVSGMEQELKWAGLDAGQNNFVFDLHSREFFG